MHFMYYDYYFLILVVPAMIFAIIAQFKVKSTFSKESSNLSSRRLTGAQAAQNVLAYYGITNVSIERVSGSLTDHYDPRSNVIRLSDDVFDNTSIAAIGVACHEAGHAAQHAENYFPLKIRNAIIPVCNIGSKLGIPLAIIGLILSIEPLVTVGLMLYALITVFQFITLPVEFDASARAMKVIAQTGILYENEQKGARRVLTAAAMTYVAALAVSLANLLRFIMIFGGRDDD